ncbi:MAG TPA: hypothetical protein PLF63_05020 [Rubrivivax sp.]|nr:hypothetical protein [Rubrivivax sp.]
MDRGLKFTPSLLYRLALQRHAPWQPEEFEVIVVQAHRPVRAWWAG